MVDSARRQRGFALIEVAVSLLLVSLGTLGLAGMQLSATRASYEAMQRSNATAYAVDILESMRANSAVLSHYAVIDDHSLPAPLPTIRCHSYDCNPTQLAADELWLWRQALAGGAELRGGLAVGGLVNASHCIRVTGNLVEVVIVWRGHEPMSQVGVSHGCGGGLDLGDTRQVLALSAFIGGPVNEAG